VARTYLAGNPNEIFPSLDCFVVGNTAFRMLCAMRRYDEWLLLVCLDATAASDKSLEMAHRQENQKEA
jgi:hypothetical protein